MHGFSIVTIGRTKNQFNNKRICKKIFKNGEINTEELVEAFDVFSIKNIEIFDWKKLIVWLYDLKRECLNELRKHSMFLKRKYQTAYTYSLRLLPGSTWHSDNGFPIYPSKQLHNGEWLTTLQIALFPQVPGHGSLHLLLIQARFDAQSEFDVHSGRHSIYGSPKYSGIQAHEPASFLSWQTAFIPHGVGWHGWLGSSCF